MKRFSVYFWLRKNTIYCYIHFNGAKCIDFSTGLKCNEPEWNQADQRCNSFLIQRELENIKRTIFDIKNLMDHNSQSYDVLTLKALYLTKSYPPALLTDVFKKLIDHKSKQKKSIRTIQTYTTRLNILIRYLADNNKKSTTITEINIAWIEKFKEWLQIAYPSISEYKNKALQSMFSTMKHAHRLGLIQNNTLQYMEYFPRVKKKKIYLTIAELKKLERFKFSQASLQRVKDLFLWQCYTGMDYSTTKNFKKDFIKQSRKGLYIQGDRSKSGTSYILPFFAPALAIWNKYEGSLPIISNRNYNTYLKNVIEMTGIEKPITTHSGRKTFSNYWESRGVDRRTIADMLGHKKVDTTLEYYSEVQIEGLWLKVA